MKSVNEFQCPENPEVFVGTRNNLGTQLKELKTYLNIRVARRSLRTLVTFRPEPETVPENRTDPVGEKESKTPMVMSNIDIRTMLKSSKSHALKY